MEAKYQEETVPKDFHPLLYSRLWNFLSFRETVTHMNPSRESFLPWDTMQTFVLELEIASARQETVRSSMEWGSAHIFLNQKAESRMTLWQIYVKFLSLDSAVTAIALGIRFKTVDAPTVLFGRLTQLFLEPCAVNIQQHQLHSRKRHA